MYAVHYLTDAGIRKYKEALNTGEDKWNAIKNNGREVIMERIINLVYRYFDIDKELFDQKCRKAEVIRAKQFALYFIKNELPGLLLREIGDKFKVHHATVIHHVDTIKVLKNIDKEYQKYFSDLSSRISELYK